LAWPKVDLCWPGLKSNRVGLGVGRTELAGVVGRTKSTSVEGRAELTWVEGRAESAKLNLRESKRGVLDQRSS